MIEQESLLTKFYYPKCKEIGCNGLLWIKFRDVFTLDYLCDTNRNHFGKKIFFETFERFYLKEKEVEKCSNCFSILDGDVSYKCKKCNKYYCTLCFIEDEHIKNDINNIEIETKKCKLHNRELVYYCIDCRQNLCNFCLKNESENERNKKHKIFNLIALMPTKEKIINLKNKIKEKNEYYEEIIKLINEWEKTLLAKTNRIKQNFKNEIRLLTTIIDNYNRYFLNYTYFNLFHSLNNYINNKNNDIFEKLKTRNFDVQKDTIFEILDSNKNDYYYKKEIKKWNLKSYHSINNGIIEKLNNSLFFEYYKKGSENKIYISKYDKKTDKIKYLLQSTFNEKVYSISISNENNQIYTCLSDKKIVKIIDYNLNKQVFTYNKNIIDDTNDILFHFNKCINISKDLLSTADDRNIIIWNKANTTPNNYNKNKTIQIYEKTSDLLLVNDEYFISSQPNIETITIIDIKSLTPEKYIPNIDCINSLNCFLLFKNYIIINCKKGIALLSIKTKEISQYFENFIGIYENKQIFLDNTNNICIMSQNEKNNFEGYYITIKKLRKNDGLLEVFEDFGVIESDEEISKIICLNERDLLFKGDNNVYLLKEEKVENQ